MSRYSSGKSNYVSVSIFLQQNVPSTALCVTMKQSVMNAPKDTF